MKVLLYTENEKLIGKSGVLTEEYIWFARGDVDLGVSGAQIDLLIERRDRIINICEIKFSSEEYIIDKDYDLKLRNKIDIISKEIIYMAIANIFLHWKI